MSVPTMIGFSAQMVYDLVDIFWIGKISSDAIAGVTVFTTIFWVIEALNEIIGVSSISLISQAFGRKDIDETKVAIEQTITFKFIMAALAAIILSIFLEPIMSLFGEADLVNNGLEYGYIRMFFLPIMFSSYSVNTALRCIGDSYTPMYIMIFVSIFNIVLDPIMMFETVPLLNIPGFNLGIFGAAVATIISQSIAFFIGFYILFSGRKGIKPSLKGLFRLNYHMDKELMTIGLPNGIEVFLRNISNTLVLGFVALYGNSAIAANGIAGRIFGFAFIPLIGFSMGGSTVVGQSLGANMVERSEKTTKIASLVSSSFMIIFTVVVVFFGNNIMSLFTQDPEVIKHGTEFLIYGSFGLVFLGYYFGMTTAFSGSGYNFPIFVSSIVSRWGVQIPILFIAISIFELPIIWVWLSYVFGDLTETFIGIIFYRQGKWKLKRVK
ncbi:MATE family efflux transporter [Geotoga petraea]|uniref:Multidrug-efflux transporter n=2 Tax=Geotoga petraea TaxID=28234 RepID=A0A4Z0W695_9BACT|nr:MATE family efflux transporter [Geotoga petraea]